MPWEVSDGMSVEGRKGEGREDGNGMGGRRGICGIVKGVMGM